MAKLLIAKPGKDALSTDERDLAFSSKLDYLKEQVSGMATTNVDGDVTITHNLGYVPTFVVFVADYDDQTIWYSYDMVGNIYATSTTLVIEGAMGWIKSRVYYALFSNPLS